MAACLSLASLPVSAQQSPTPQQFRFVQDVTAPLKSTLFHSREFVSAGPMVAGTLLDVQALGVPPGVRMDAVTFDQDLLSIAFSTDTPWYYAPSSRVIGSEDVIFYSQVSSSFTTLIDSSVDMGLPPEANIDALAIYSSNLYFSIDITLTLPMIGVIDDDDVLRYNPDTHTLNKVIDGTLDWGIPDYADLDALHVDATHFYFSLDTPATISAQTGAPHDLWKVAANPFTITRIPMSAFDSRADLTGLESLRDSDQDGLSNYEELTGVDDPATTFGQTTHRLSPNGYTSDPQNAHSDSDGVPDNEEAIAGTDPTSSNDYLRITGLSRKATNDVVVWSSVSDRVYELRSADATSGSGLAFTNLAAIIAADPGPETTYTNPSPVHPSIQLYSITVRPQ